jgi:hypothetical protein
VLVFDQFLSCCCSDHPGIEALFEPHSWLEVLVILLASKKRVLGWSLGPGEFPWKALLFFHFCLLLYDWHWKETDSIFSETQNFIFNSCFLPHQHGKSLINYPSYLSGLLVITQFSSLVFSTQFST